MNFVFAYAQRCQQESPGEHRAPRLVELRRGGIRKTPRTRLGSLPGRLAWRVTSHTRLPLALHLPL